MMAKYTLTFIFSICLLLGTAQTWYKKYPINPAWDAFVVPSYDEGMYLFRRMPGGIAYWIGKLDINGSLLWEKQINRPFILDNAIPTSDGGMLICGRLAYNNFSVNNVYLIKLNKCAEREWVYELDTNNNSYATSCCIGSDNDFYLAVDVIKGGNVPDDTKRYTSIYCISNSGIVKWNKPYIYSDVNVSIEVKGDFLYGSGEGYFPYYKSEPGMVFKRALLFKIHTKTQKLTQFYHNDSNDFFDAFGKITFLDDSLMAMHYVGHYTDENNVKTIRFGTTIRNINFDSIASYERSVLSGENINYGGEMFHYQDSTYIKFIAVFNDDGMAGIGLQAQKVLVTRNQFTVLDSVNMPGNEFYLTRYYLTHERHKLVMSYGTDGDYLNVYKYNTDLLPDTFTTRTIHYDSLCGAQINNDPIDGRTDKVILGLGNPAGSREAKLVLYPNPAQHTLTLDFPAENNYTQVVITSIDGKVIFNREVDTELKQVWDIGYLNNGLYFILISTKTGDTVKCKFVVAR